MLSKSSPWWYLAIRLIDCLIALRHRWLWTWKYFSINNKNPKIWTKRPHCPLRHPAPSLGHWYTGVYLRIFDPGPSNPTTFLGLCSLGDYRQSIESPMGVLTFNSTEKALTFTIYDCILRIRSKKVCYLTKVSPLDVELF